MAPVTAPRFSSSNTSDEFDLSLFKEVNSHVRHERFDELLGLIYNDHRRYKPLNLTDDPVLNIVISANKTQLAVKLIESVESTKLREKNILGDTPLHIAAVEGDISVAKALLQRDRRLIEVVNIERETAMHKAAMYGRQSMFWCLVDECGSRMANAMYRKGDGSSILHCAITGSAPELALDIARNFHDLIKSRDEAGLTPLQLIFVTIPSFLRNPLVSGRLRRFLYKRSRVRYGVLVILKQFYPPAYVLEKEKERYMATLKLVEYLAAWTSFDFCGKVYTREPNPTIFDAMRSHSDLQYTWRDDDTEEGMLKNIPNEVNRMPNRWMEPPLIIAAELGLDDFVRKILQVCPQSAIYLDSKGRNVMQVAIQSGHEKVVRVISKMLQGSNPVLPSCLPSMLDNKTRNTILHLAAENSPAEEGPLQLYDDLVWFEMVEKIVPKQLVYSRNRAHKTAHELFTERHKTMLDSCKKQLVEIGKMCSGLVAAAVFASSFSFPNEKKTNSVKLAFMIFSHAYVIGFGCAAMAMVLFMSLVIVPYKMRYFRRAIPMQFLFACLSFVLALVAFLVSFACNFVVQIYGGEKTQTTHFSIFSILELLIFPVVCITVLRDFGAKFGLSFTRFLK